MIKIKMDKRDDLDIVQAWLETCTISLNRISDDILKKMVNYQEENAEVEFEIWQVIEILIVAKNKFMTI